MITLPSLRALTAQRDRLCLKSASALPAPHITLPALDINFDRFDTRVPSTSSRFEPLKPADEGRTLGCSGFKLILLVPQAEACNSSKIKKPIGARRFIQKRGTFLAYID